VLELDGNKYYVGKTTNPDFRLETHFDVGGSAWTIKYKPIKLIELITGCDNFDEDKYTLKYMEKYGIDNVRGGSFCEIKLSEENTNTIKRMLAGSTDKCYICGKTGHFVSECDAICLEDIYDLKKKFIFEAKKFDKLNNCFIQCNDIIKVFNKIDKSFNLTVNNIYSISQNINKIDELKPILEYKKEINYYDFIDGFVHIIKSFDSKKNSNLKTNFEYTCFRCGRIGHKSTECYAKTTYSGNEFEEKTYKELEIYCCDYCGKEYETLKGLTCHQNLYCKKTISISKYTCFKCGRAGHKSTECYASTHINGKKIY